MFRQERANENEEEVGGETPTESPKKKKKRAKRGRGLKRELTNTEIALFRHPTHPLIVKEWAHIFSAGYMVLGTPEAGLTSMAGLELGDIPIIALPRNSAHQQYLNEFVKEKLIRAMLSKSGPLRFTTLAKRWEQVKTK